MDEKKLNCAMLELAKIIQANQEREAQAVKGYTEQLGAIDEVINELALSPNETEKIAFLEQLREATEEKISDELNHQKGLLYEYVNFTNIPIAEE